MNPKLLCGLLLFGGFTLKASSPVFPRFRAVEIDSHIEIGYGITVADVDGDGKPDILLADKKQIVWYRNPSWEKFVLAENLTVQDDVCIAAADINGDGKAEIAVGAQWNPGDTLNSGAVFYLVPPSDRTRKWEPIELHHEPTVHRMRWMRIGPGQFQLVVAPLHGRGNKNGEGEGAKILGYQMPADPHQPWKTELIDGSLHMTHNFDIIKSKEAAQVGLFLASKEGVFELIRQPTGWSSRQVVGPEPGDTHFSGVGEVRAGHLAGNRAFLATIEPMHGNQLVVYTPPDDAGSGHFWKRYLLDSSLKEGHALACGDLVGNGSDQIVAGWRGKNDQGKVGIKLFAAPDGQAAEWTQSVVDDNTMACEDLCLADLNGDGKLDIVASGRATHKVKVYFNQ
ncbi:MAG TPA: FG-GAP and VCBS repeat-containing protein [Verrucomicrobiae bacterium]|nr:FG-GAP and VCBS repeat-containing protein [Verrucomicrobiae bacterium]